MIFALIRFSKILFIQMIHKNIDNDFNDSFNPRLSCSIVQENRRMRNRRKFDNTKIISENLLKYRDYELDI